MLDLKFIKANRLLVENAIKVKNESLDLNALLSIDSELSLLVSELQSLQASKNETAKEIQKVSPELKEQLISVGKKIAHKISTIKPKVDELKEKLNELMLQVPNVPSPLAPVGKDANSNVVVKTIGDKPNFTFHPLNHIQLLEKNGWADFENISNICGSRSYALKNEMLFLEMALHRFTLDKLYHNGFDLFSTPSMVRENALVGTGHFPAGKEQVYTLPADNLFLSGTAEVQLNSLHAGQILKETELPLKYAGYSSCFRREAGSYGKDVRGLIRVHQFIKVEQYIICKNDIEESEKWHKFLLNIAEEILRDLELPYQVVECCTGDMGTGKFRMYDIETWVPSEGHYRETHSCSALHDWQARRTGLRYRATDGQVHHCFTLNNTAIATPRILVPLLENHQREDGSITVPKALASYLGKKTHLTGIKSVT